MVEAGIRLFRDYIAGDMEYFYKQVEKLTRVELLELANNLEGLSNTLRRHVELFDKALKYPAENEE